VPFLGNEYRLQSGASIEDELRLARLALASTTDGVLMHRPDGTLVLFNEAVAASLGYDVQEFAALPPFGWTPARNGNPEETQRRIRAIMQPEGHTFTSNVIRPDGQEIFQEVHSRFVETPDGGLIVSVSHDITDKIRAEQLLRDLAYHDPLTGLANRASFDGQFEVVLASARRHNDLVGVIFVDLDGFKEVNDVYGHDTGDHALVAIAHRLEGAVRSEDIVARVGGDEFVVVAPRLEDATDLERVAHKLRDAVAKPLQIAGVEVHMTAATGVALFNPESDDARSVLVRADVAMYESKRRPRKVL
jgi:diguanylate cyclase (GGDEF)-like protein/PAS domain S-box-containing protein